METSIKATALETLDMGIDYRISAASQQGGTALDDHEMHRMGKSKNSSSNYQGLENGGLADMFWSCIWTFIGFGYIIASLSEMASIAPTDGGQYHWVSEFSSPRYQKFLSYITGWMSVLAWQSGTASGSFLTGTIIQGLISVRNPDYDVKGCKALYLCS
ncbi:hypothetical protein N7530_006380 [Penicillium desertorum]|uniref:Uncharacterized protein n=1 Tax=Penicillium desertorum TaxID=1303715 RepID=A0A9W9WRP9_9EURO|nr:hypothetical protein N7530_006380 [Penicillium desertorum]